MKVNRSSVKSPFGTLSSLSDFNHIRNRLFPSRGCHVHYQTIFDFYRDVRSVLDGYRRFNEVRIFVIIRFNFSSQSNGFSS